MAPCTGATGGAPGEPCSVPVSRCSRLSAGTGLGVEEDYDRI